MDTYECSSTCHVTLPGTPDCRNAVIQGQIPHLKCKHHTLLLLTVLTGKSIEVNQNMAACLLFPATLGVFSVIFQNCENCQV